MRHLRLQDDFHNIIYFELNVDYNRCVELSEIAI